MMSVHFSSTSSSSSSKSVYGDANGIDPATDSLARVGRIPEKNKNGSAMLKDDNEEKEVDERRSTNDPIEIPFRKKSGISTTKSDVLGLYPTPLVEFANFIPLRLNERERMLLNVLESTLNVSEYTDTVDVSVRFSSKNQRIIDGILEVCNIAVGLATAAGLDDVHLESERHQQHHTVSYKLASRTPRQNETFLQDLYEIGRRNKVLNPSKMRGTYGKLMYLLQDAQCPTVAKTLGFHLYKELVMVRPHLEYNYYRGLELLQDSRLEEAVQYVDGFCPSTGRRLSRSEVNAVIAHKRQITDELVREYANTNYTNDTHGEDDNNSKTNCHQHKKETTESDEQDECKNDEMELNTAPPPKKHLTEQEVRRCIDSIADAVATCVSNIKPVQRMLQLLEENFDPKDPKKKGKYSNLTLTSTSSYATTNNHNRYSPYNNFLGGQYYYGFGGTNDSHNTEESTLSHSHPTQYVFVWQSLKLWCEVQKHMHRLWVCADDDLLSTQCTYSLRNTGQGLNRVQSCPRVGKIMRHLLTKVQKDAGAPWVGLSVIHLGDRDVPNALIFIDKYTQIPRFLRPIVDFIDGLEELCSTNQGIGAYISREFDSLDQLKMLVLSDYFKHGFDGSGDDGGSCIDGRLTSSWNWTSRIVKKPYYHAFMLSGFQGFDGDFK